MDGKTVLVTGGTAGIGLATALWVAGLGARVGIVGRDRDRARSAAETIRTRHPDATVDIFVADLSVQAEVRRLAQDVLDSAWRDRGLLRPRPTPPFQH